MGNFQATYKGPFSLLIQVQDMLKCTQLRIVAVSEPIETSIGTLTNVVPKDMEKMWIQETLMCCLIKLDERARLAQQGERDEYHPAKFRKNLLRGTWREHGLLVPQ